MHTVDSCVSMIADLEELLGVVVAVFVAQPVAALRGCMPTPRHLRSQTSKTSSISFFDAGLPSRRTTRLYWFSTSARPASSCRTVRSTPSSMSSGSKPVMTIGT